MDLADRDPALRVLAYAHPLWMAVGLGLAAIALRSGMRLRRHRRSGIPLGHRVAVERRRHLRIAKPALLWLAVGALFGPISMVWLRGRPPLETAHGYVAVGALLLLFAAGAFGRALERGAAGKLRDWHAALATCAILVCALAFATGWVLLP